MPGKYKELCIEFIRRDDGCITLKVKPSDTEYSTNEIYMAYRYLYQMLYDMKFDWSIENEIKTIVEKKEEN